VALYRSSPDKRRVRNCTNVVIVAVSVYVGSVRLDGRNDTGENAPTCWPPAAALADHAVTGTADDASDPSFRPKTDHWPYIPKFLCPIFSTILSPAVVTGPATAGLKVPVVIIGTNTATVTTVNSNAVRKRSTNAGPRLKHGPRHQIVPRYGYNNGRTISAAVRPLHRSLTVETRRNRPKHRYPYDISSEIRSFGNRPTSIRSKTLFKLNLERWSIKTPFPATIMIRFLGKTYRKLTKTVHGQTNLETFAYSFASIHWQRRRPGIVNGVAVPTKRSAAVRIRRTANGRRRNGLAVFSNILFTTRS